VILLQLNENKNRALCIAKKFISKDSMDLYYKEICNGCTYNNENIEALCCCYCQDGNYYERLK
jgi:hypothetical protein